MTQMTQEQQAALQATAAQVVAKFEGFVAALPGDEQQILALTIAGAPYGADGKPAREDQDDVTGYASVFGTIWSDIKFTACVAGAATAAIAVNGESFGNGVSNASDFCREHPPQ